MSNPDWADVLIGQYERAYKAARPGSRPDRLVYSGAGWFRRFVTPSCSISLKRADLNKEIEALVQRAAREQERQCAERREGEERAYWEARGICTGHAYVVESYA